MRKWPFHLPWRIVVFHIIIWIYLCIFQRILCHRRWLDMCRYYWTYEIFTLSPYIVTWIKTTTHTCESIPSLPWRCTLTCETDIVNDFYTFSYSYWTFKHRYLTYNTYDKLYNCNSIWYGLLIGTRIEARKCFASIKDIIHKKILKIPNSTKNINFQFKNSKHNGQKKKYKRTNNDL